MMAEHGRVAELNHESKTADQRNNTAHLLDSPAAGILAALGFACLTAWGICQVFAPALPLLSYLPIDEGIACLLVSCGVSMVALIVCARWPHLLYTHVRSLVFPGMLVFYGPLALVGIVSWLAPYAIPTPLVFAAWAISGIGWVSPSAAWMVLYSLMPARWSA